MTSNEQIRLEDVMRAWVEPVAVVGASIATIAGVGIVTGSAVWAVLFAVLCFLIIFNI